jgi:hypothetical protein
MLPKTRFGAFCVVVLALASIVPATIYLAFNVAIALETEVMHPGLTISACLLALSFVGFVFSLVHFKVVAERAYPQMESQIRVRRKS